MKTIKGRLLATVSAAAFIVLFIGAAAGATVVGSAGIGSAVGAGLLTGVLGHRRGSILGFGQRASADCGTETVCVR